VICSASLAFLSLDAASVFASHLGESERVLRDAFQRARANRPCVLFLDELDAMTGQRGGSSTSLENRIVATLLTEMDGVEAASGVLVVGATNRPALIDAALMRPGRFDVLLHVPPPDAAERAEIVRVLLRRQEFEPEVALRIDEIAERTQGCSGADLTSLARESAVIALRRDPLAARVLWQDWDHALSELQPSLTVEIVQDHFDFERRVSQQK
jgi:transitional endoplasmic reticulum ATPase